MRCMYTHNFACRNIFGKDCGSTHTLTKIKKAPESQQHDDDPAQHAGRLDRPLRAPLEHSCRRFSAPPHHGDRSELGPQRWRLAPDRDRAIPSSSRIASPRLPQQQPHHRPGLEKKCPVCGRDGRPLRGDGSKGLRVPAGGERDAHLAAADPPVKYLSTPRSAQERAMADKPIAGVAVRTAARGLPRSISAIRRGLRSIALPPGGPASASRGHVPGEPSPTALDLGVSSENRAGSPAWTACRPWFSMTTQGTRVCGA